MQASDSLWSDQRQASEQTSIRDGRDEQNGLHVGTGRSGRLGWFTMAVYIACDMDPTSQI